MSKMSGFYVTYHFQKSNGQSGEGCGDFYVPGRTKTLTSMEVKAINSKISEQMSGASIVIRNYIWLEPELPEPINWKFWKKTA